MRHLARREVTQRLARPFVGRHRDQRLVGGKGAGFGGDVGAQIAHWARAFLDVARRPRWSPGCRAGADLAPDGEQGAAERLALLAALGVGLDQVRHDLEMAELLGRNVHQHVAKIIVVGVLCLGEVLQTGRKLARRPAELLQQELRELGVWLGHDDGMKSTLSCGGTWW